MNVNKIIDNLLNKEGIPCEKHQAIYGRISLECRECIENFRKEVKNQ